MRQTSAWAHCNLSAPARKAFTRIAQAWCLTDQEQSAILGKPLDAAFASLEPEGADASHRETLERVSFIIGIYIALHTIFPNAQQANSWVRRTNNAPFLNGATALEHMCSGKVGALASVRQHLESQGLAP